MDTRSTTTTTAFFNKQMSKTVDSPQLAERLQPTFPTQSAPTLIFDKAARTATLLVEALPCGNIPAPSQQCFLLGFEGLNTSTPEITVRRLGIPDVVRQRVEMEAWTKVRNFSIWGRVDGDRKKENLTRDLRMGRLEQLSEKISDEETESEGEEKTSLGGEIAEVKRKSRVNEDTTNPAANPPKVRPTRKSAKDRQVYPATKGKHIESASKVAPPKSALPKATPKPRNVVSNYGLRSRKTSNSEAERTPTLEEITVPTSESAPLTSEQVEITVTSTSESHIMVREKGIPQDAILAYHEFYGTLIGDNWRQLLEKVDGVWMPRTDSKAFREWLQVASRERLKEIVARLKEFVNAR